jgi:hypothetical protein
MHGGEENAYRILWWKSKKEIDHYENLDIGGGYY